MSLIVRVTLAAVTVFAIVSSHQQARADCSAASIPIDKLICNTPDIAAKDRALNEKYRAAMAQLSDAGKQHLRNGQRKWLALVRAYCPSRIGQSTDSFGGSGDDCLRHEYDARLAQLDGAAVRIGPYLVSRLDDFAFRRGAPGEKDGYRSGFHYRVRSLPYIDQPSTPETEAWNRRVADLADQTERELLSEHFDGQDDPASILDLGSMDVSFALGLGSDDFLSVAIDAFVYVYGRPHGWGKVSTSAWLLKSAQEMKLAEIFRRGTDWEAAVRAECEAELKKNDGAQDTSCDDAGPESGWIPTNRGPQVLVFLDAVPFMNVYGLASVDLTWSNLRPLLRPDLPFAIPPE